MTETMPAAIVFPPSPFVRESAAVLPAGRSLDVLDAGCWTGRNAIYMASLGHRAVGLNIEFEELQLARTTPQENISFVMGDVRNLPFRRAFDVVLLNEVLQDIPKNDLQVVFDSIKSVTRPDGFNIVSGYIGNKPAALQRGELPSFYESDEWEIDYYKEDRPHFNTSGAKPELDSRAKLIARRKPLGDKTAGFRH